MRGEGLQDRRWGRDRSQTKAVLPAPSCDQRAGHEVRVLAVQVTGGKSDTCIQGLMCKMRRRKVSLSSPARTAGGTEQVAVGTFLYNPYAFVTSHLPPPAPAPPIPSVPTTLPPPSRQSR